MTLMSKLMTGAGALALSTGFAAAAPAVVESDLNLRAGPGVEFPVVAAMPGGATVNVMGCQASWCQVAFGGTTGWASQAYLGMGGGVAAGPAYRGFGEGYAYRGVGPGYGYDEDTYAYGGYSPGYSYGYYGGTGYGGSYGTYGGERSFNNVRTSNSERLSADQNSLRSTRRSSATTSVGVNAGARAETQTAPAIKGNNPMKAEKSEPAVSNAQPPSAVNGNNPMKVGSRNAAASQQRGTAQAGATRGNARETTGAAPREKRY